MTGMKARALADRVAILGLVAVVSLATVMAGAPARAAEVAVARRMVDDLKAGFATVEATDVLEARARIGGTLGGLSVDEGSEVADGQVIATVGDRKLMFEVSARDARASSVGAEVSQARSEYNRTRELASRGVVAQARLDDAQAKLHAAERNLQAMYADRNVAAQQAKEGNVESPATGRVLKVSVTNGSVVMPGDVIALIAPSNYILRLRMPERNARFIKVGTPVFVGPRGLETNDPDKLTRGEVAQVYPSMDHGRVVADVKVDGLGDYFVGERALVYVTAGTRPAYVLPEEFLARRFGVSYVRLKDGSEVVVQPGRKVDGGIEILSGVSEGDVVATP